MNNNYKSLQDGRSHKLTRVPIKTTENRSFIMLFESSSVHQRLKPHPPSITSCRLIDILVLVLAPMQVLLQSGPGVVAAGQQELRGAAGGAVHQPHRQLQDRRAGYRRSRGGQVSQTRRRVSSHPPPDASTAEGISIGSVGSQVPLHLV